MFHLEKEVAKMCERRDVNVHTDRAHAGKPVHVDLTQPFDKGIGQSGAGAHKIEVDGQGRIISDNVT